MAFEGSQLRIPGAVAAADLSTKQFYCVKKNSTNNQVALCDTDGELFIGILQDKPNAAGVAACVAFHGVSKVIAGEALTAGNTFGTDNAGKAKIVETTSTGADVGDYVAGWVLEGAASGAIATVLLVHGYKVFAS